MRSTSRLAIALAFSAAALPLAASPASAQSGDPVDAVLACRTIADIEARLACFDTASGALEAARNSGQIATITRDDVEAMEGDSFGFRMPSLPRLRMPFFERSARVRSHDALNDVATTSVADSSSPAETSSSAQTAPASQSPAPSPSAPAQTTAPTQAPVQSASAAPAEPPSVEIVERDDDGNVDRVRMNVERIRTVGYNTLVFHMENGQVWRQTDDQRLRIPRNRDGLYAEIRRASLGSYLLRLNGQGRAVVVRRDQ